MADHGMGPLASAFRFYRSNRKHLTSEDGTSRYLAERWQEDYREAIDEEMPVAIAQYRAMEDGLNSLRNRLGDLEGWQFSREDVIYEIERIMRKVYDLQREGEVSDGE